jgi:Tol biopolymer transport system component
LVTAGGFGFWRYRSSSKNPPVIPFVDARIKQLTTKGKIRNAAVSPDGKFFAYVLNERGEFKNSLWLGQTDGSRDIQLRPPDDESLIGGLAFSPDGATLYFSLTETQEETRGGLYKMPVIGGVAEKLSDKVGSRFALSPDGKQIAYFRRSKTQNASAALVVADLGGASERELLTRPREKNFSPTSNPAWSPDGELIAFGAIQDAAKRSLEIFTARAADGHLEQLTALEWYRFGNLIWRRDGRGLVVSAISRNEAFRHLWQIDYPSGGAARLSPDTGSYYLPLSVSADGNQLLAVQLLRESNIWIAPADDFSAARQITFSAINGVHGWHGFDWTNDGRIVFTAGVDRSIAVYSMNADGGGVRQITSAGFFDQKPSATADGSLIVFQSNRSGDDEIWRVRADGSDLRQLTTGGGNSAPGVTPDGKWVIYVSTREGKNFLRRVSVEGGAPMEITGKATLADPRVSPDGRFVACGYKASDEAPPQLAVVSIDDGKPLKLFDVERAANLNQSFRWTPDGSAVCYRDWANGVWKQNLNGGAPEKIAGLPEEKLYNFGWSANGKLFAYTRGREITDAVLITNF